MYFSVMMLLVTTFIVPFVCHFGIIKDTPKLGYVYMHSAVTFTRRSYLVLYVAIEL